MKSLISFNKFFKKEKKNKHAIKRFESLVFFHPNRSNGFTQFQIYSNIQVERKQQKSNFQEFQKLIFKGSTKVELSLKREFPGYASGYSPSVSLPRSRFFFLPRWITRLSHARDSQPAIFARSRMKTESRQFDQAKVELKVESWLNTQVWNFDVSICTFPLRISLELEGKGAWIG